MFKKKIFGMFRKDTGEEGAESSDQPLISGENVTSEIDADNEVVDGPPSVRPEPDKVP